MTKSVGVHEAKTHLSRLLAEVTKSGTEITITNRGVEVARLMPARVRSARVFGSDRGVLEVPADFDDLPAEVDEMFEL